MGPADLLITPLQRALDSLIASRARSRDQAAALDGRTVALEFTELGLALALSGEDGRLVVRRGSEAPAPEATLSGTSAAFLSAGFGMAMGAARTAGARPDDVPPGGPASRARAATLPPGLTVIGDALLVRDLRALLAGLELDPEERAARLIGDAPAHQLGRALRAFAGWTRYAGDRLGRDLGDYLREETRDLVAKDEVAAFVDGVDRVRDDVERAAARLAQIEQSLAARHGRDHAPGGAAANGTPR